MTHLENYYQRLAYAYKTKHNKMEDQVTFETSDHSEKPVADDSQSLRSEMISLAEKHEIKQSVAYIKKASHSALEKIKADYERKQLQETNEYLSETLMEKLSEFMEGVNMIDNAKSIEEELLHNKMVKRDLKNILGYVTPYVPLIGLVCGISIMGKHMLTEKRKQHKQPRKMWKRNNTINFFNPMGYKKLGAIIRGDRNLTLFLCLKNNIHLILLVSHTYFLFQCRSQAYILSLQPYLPRFVMWLC